MKCRNCVEYIDEWCDKVKDSTYPDIERECKHFKQATNADRIRAMTDDELTELLYAWHLSTFHKKKEWIHNWLKKEVRT